MATTLSYINLFLIIFLAIFIFVVVFAIDRNRVAVTNIAWRVQTGANAATDNMMTGGNNLYITNSALSTNPVLTITSSPNNTIGRQIAIKNTSANVVTLQAGSGVTLNGSATVTAGSYALYVVDTTTPNSFRRMF